MSATPESPRTQQALNRAMMEAVDHVHAAGWDSPPVLFALVETSLLVDATGAADLIEGESPLTLVQQDDLPPHIEGGSDELGDFISRLAWPEQVTGVILAQEILFRDTAGTDPDEVSDGRDTPIEARPARLFSGVLRGGEELTLLQLRPTEEELAQAGPFAEDEISLRGGPGVAPGVIAALHYTLEQPAVD
ncbi:PPA1309 family protein [Corynebacterium sp. P7003]|uniref:PPA1309 family protein n=1 Tax=Corynebacterium pygosceleis TaxID=2800406 RepID=A0ABT3WR64_9CORY|nr:PPA1309 family protein [Corynebacterium pygosceleis]MCX7444717.1 PPA1309 family protein [Corynebacterium pygosceleis]